MVSPPDGGLIDPWSMRSSWPSSWATAQMIQPAASPLASAKVKVSVNGSPKDSQRWGLASPDSPRQVRSSSSGADGPPGVGGGWTSAPSDQAASAPVSPSKKSATPRLQVPARLSPAKALSGSVGEHSPPIAGGGAEQRLSQATVASSLSSA